MKKRLYFNEYNVRMGGFSYLPLVSGLLRSHAETFPEIRDGYEFMPFIYAMDVPSRIMAQYTAAPDLACFSSMMWNEQLNYRIAAEVKRRWPECLIVFGGPNVPMPPQHDIEAWMSEHPFVDVAVRAEGEEPFAEILKRHAAGQDFKGIPDVACRATKDGSGAFPDRGDCPIDFCGEKKAFERGMEYPSPYLAGLYDDLLAWGAREGHQFQAVIETSRGCPFPCTFCYWGRGGLSRKFRYKNLDRLFSEIDWMGRNKIRYVFNADSNFGMHDRDYEIAEHIVATKRKYGFPEKFRTCFGKNTDEKILRIGALFHANQLEKGITLARQSNDVETLKNIRRSNIRMSTYVNLQKRFNDLDIPVYCELILGLPGETKETWRKGVDELLEAGTQNQLFIYLCQVLTNTEMAERSYQQKHGIQTRRIKLAEIHGQERPPEFVQEYESIIVATNSMPPEDWVESLRFSYVLMLFHSLKIAYYLMIFLLDRWGIKMSEFIQFVAERAFDAARAPIMAHELDFYDRLIEGMIREGEHRGSFLPDYGDLYWDVEEASFLRITQDTEKFYSELLGIVYQLLNHKNVDYLEDLGLVTGALLYQKARIPQQPNGRESGVAALEFDHNFPEYYDRRFSTKPVPLAKRRTWMRLQPENYRGDVKEFARKSILWGRKSGTMLVKQTYGFRE